MTKTSAEWAEIYRAKGVHILDSDGWDRDNWEYSWEQEQITEEEFKYRLAFSTVQRPAE